MAKRPRTCAAAGCQDVIKGRRVVCIFHYRNLDIFTRSRITDLLRDGAVGDARDLAARFFTAVETTVDYSIGLDSLPRMQVCK